MEWCVIVLVLLLYFQLNNGSEFHNRKKRIVGGYMSPEGFFPFAVSLRLLRHDAYVHFCGGAIISEYYILSSAHCVVMDNHVERQCYKAKYVVANRMKHQMIAVVGTNQKNDADGTSYQIASFMYHIDFGFKQGTNDISLLKTAHKIEFTINVAPIEIHNLEVPPNSDVIVAGWGLTSYPGDTSDTLKFVDLKTISYEECAKIWNVLQSQICTYTTYGEGVCTSDSGGPLVYKGELVGLVSFGRPCAVGYPDVFTNVTYMYEWVTHNINCLNDIDKLL